MSHDEIFDQILRARGLPTKEVQRAFLDPRYDEFRHDAFLLPDMALAVERLVRAHANKEKIVIYGDYDIDGLTATTVLLDAFESFGFEGVEAYIPNRFVEGYGLTVDAVERIVEMQAQLIVTVDCGSLSEKEIRRAGELGVDVIVTDHHNVAPVQPPAVAVVNPKRLLQDFPERYVSYILSESSLIGHAASGRESSEILDVFPADRPSAHMTGRDISQSRSLYPFVDLAGVGVAFKLVQALQTRLPGLEDGKEKWLLDLVALGTVCDVVTLRNENRANVRWGLEVMKKTRRPGIRALMAVSGVKPGEVTARSLGFGLGPRLNAAGRLETAQIALDLLRATDPQRALELAEQLDIMNTERRAEQDRIFKEAIIQAETLANDPVLIVSDPSWSHGIIGIVAAKLLERFHKPTFVLQEMGEQSKGSARSFGDFSAADAIRATEQLIIKGGGHKLAAGVTLETKNIAAWRTAVNDYYRQLALAGQADALQARADVTLEVFDGINEALVRLLSQLEPFGNGNAQPVLGFTNLTVIQRRLMGADQQHVKYAFADAAGRSLQALAFNASDRFVHEPGEIVNVWCELDINEWQGRRSVEGRLLRLEDV